jgi:hypothetical protein
VNRSLLLLLALAATPVPVSGQALSIFFSTDGTEVARSGAGGSAASPGNPAAIFRDEEVLMVSPAPAMPSAVACAHRTTWAAFFGDEDGDSNFTESIAGNLDALHLPPGSPNPPSIFDLYVSFSDDCGPLGATGGVFIRDGDVFRILPGGGVLHFITETQIQLAMNTSADLDVNGFTVNPLNGDLFWTMTTTQAVNGTSLEDGGLVRLPASGYVAASDGRVLSVTPGSAQIALHEVHLNVFYFVAGLGAVGDLDGVAIAPTGGTFTGPGGITLPNFWFVADNPPMGPAIVSTVGGGTIPLINGVSMIGGPAFGLGATDYQGGNNSTITALAWAPFSLATRPRSLTMFDPALVTPGPLTIGYGGGVPGPNLYLFANFAISSPAGASTPRTTAGLGFPLAVPGGFPELYVDDFYDPLFSFTAMLPPLVVDSDGYASVSFFIPVTPPGLALVIQGIDTTNLALTTPVVVVSQ